jgi:glycerol uptake facilitator protein
VGPLVGGVLGAGVYQVLVHPFLPARVRALEAERMATAGRVNAHPAE